MRGFLVYALILVAIVVIAESFSLFSAPSAEKLNYNDLL